MPWSVPTTPVSGTAITVAWATSSVVTPLLWLRALMGNGDPPGAGYSVDSLSTTTTTWRQKVNREGDTMTGDLMVNRTGSAAPTTGFLVLGNDTAKFFGFDGTTHVLVTPRFDIRNDLYVYRVGTPSQGYVILGNSAAHFVGFDGANVVADGNKIWTDANTANAVTTAKIADTNVTAAKLNADVPIVPLNGVIWFPTLADLTAAGSRWSRHTAADGRLLVGAGTAGSPTLSNPQTFTEATNYGTDWGHSHGSSALTVTGGTDGPTITVAVQSGAGTTVAASNHGHNIGGVGGTTGDVGGTTDSTVWLPGALRAGIWGRRSS